MPVYAIVHVGLTGKGVLEVDSPKSKVIWESAKGRYLPIKPPSLLPGSGSAYAVSFLLAPLEKEVEYSNTWGQA